MMWIYSNKEQILYIVYYLILYVVLICHKGKFSTADFTCVLACEKFFLFKFLICNLILIEFSGLNHCIWIMHRFYLDIIPMICTLIIFGLVG